MNKWIAIPVIAVLAVGLIVGGYFLWQQTSKLGEAESEIVALEGDVSALEGDVATLEGDVSTLEGDVSTLEGNVSTLESDLAKSEITVEILEFDLRTANSKVSNLQADVRTQQTINSSLSDELEIVKDPRHFASMQELTDYLHEDDTDTKYEGEDFTIISYIRQVRALRDGYLLPVSLFESGGDLWVYNTAVIDSDEVYAVGAWDDETMLLGYLGTSIPSHPLPLD